MGNFVVKQLGWKYYKVMRTLLQEFNASSWARGNACTVRATAAAVGPGVVRKARGSTALSRSRGLGICNAIEIHRKQYI